MRTDVTIDNVAIRCPNATHIGFAKPVANTGDIIAYKEHLNDGSYQTRTARVLGRVSTHDGEIKGWALVLTLSECATTCYERWVDPADIMEVRDVPTAFAAFFFAGQLPYDVATMRRLNEHGTLNQHYIQNHAERVATWKAREEQSS